MNLEVMWNISFKTPTETWDLGVLAECRIEKSAKNLADRAIITLPEANFNKVLRIQDTISRGDQVMIKLGYRDLIWETEFSGYVKEIITNDNSLTIECEDALFLFRNGVKDRQFKPASISTIAQYLIGEINPDFELDCDYNIGYEKFTIYKATAYDVLAKIQEETGADIYFENKTLHIHPAYTRKGGEADFSPQCNIEKFNLEYKTAIDRKVEVTIESTGMDGKVKKYTVGQPGGEKVTKTVDRMSEQSIRMIADNEYKTRMSDGYEGSFESWLFPYVEPSFTIGIYDDDYPYKDGRYYVDAVTTVFSSEGIRRSVELGIKLSA